MRTANLVELVPELTSTGKRRSERCSGLLKYCSLVQSHHLLYNYHLWRQALCMNSAKISLLCLNRSNINPPTPLEKGAGGLVIIRGEAEASRAEQSPSAVAGRTVTTV